MSKVLITSIDGSTGRGIARHLLECPEYKAKVSEIIGLATDDIPKDLKSKGVVIFKSDPSSPEKHVEVFKAADVIVFIPPAKENKVEICKALLEACKEAGTDKKKCILISMAATDIADPNSQPHLAAFQEIEEAVKQCIKSCSIMRPNFYAENILLYAEQIKNGELPVPIHDGKFAPVYLEDVADATCMLLSNPKKCQEHRGQVLTLTGSEALSGTEMAERMSKCLGFDVRFKDITNQEAMKILSNVQYLDQSERLVLLEFYELVKARRAEFVTADLFEKLVGREPTKLEKFFEMYKDELKPKA